MKKKRDYAAPRVNEIAISGRQTMITTSVDYDDTPGKGGGDVGAKKNDWSDEDEDTPFDEDSSTYSIW